MWMQNRKGKERLALELFIAGRVIVVMLLAVAAKAAIVQ